MSTDGQLIVCRRCNEIISLEEGACPHCGTSIRGNLAYFAGIIFGVVLVGMTLFNIGELLAFGVLGLLVGGISLYLFYNKRQRIQQASEQSDLSVEA